MKKELQEILFEQFPKLYSQRHLSKQETCMSIGICCGDGWFDLLKNLSLELTEYCNDIEAVQVKEKFGGLRFYVNKHDEKISEIISKFEKMSYSICRECGKENDNKISYRGQSCSLCNKNRK